MYIHLQAPIPELPELWAEQRREFDTDADR
jgi:hypothetical protein